MRNATEIAISKFSWGTLRVVQVGHNYSVVIHPNHYATIEKLADGERGSFVEETGRTWKVKRVGETIQFSSGNYRAAVNADELAGE